jgi:hypothetical protein
MITVRFLPIGQCLLKKSILHPLLVSIWYIANIQAQSKQVVLSGYIKDGQSSETIVHATLSFSEGNKLIQPNQYGYYTCTLPVEKTCSIKITALGYYPLDTSLFIRKDTELNFDLVPYQLNEVVIEAPSTGHLQLNMAQVPVERLKSIPMLLGQPDLIKALTFLPGVSAGTEGTTGLYVRGGTPDQNLLLLDGATVYNASHLFGFQSVFDPSAIKDVKLYKGGFPARYGGRLSSVVDITMKEGNNKKRHGEATLGLINSGLMLEGPIKKERSSYMVSGRAAYLGLLLLPTYFGSKNREDKPFNTMISYDINAKINHQFKNNDRIFASFYRGADSYLTRFLQDSVLFKSQLSWGNKTGSIRYVKSWNERLFSQTLVCYNFYQLTEYNEQTETSSNEQGVFSRSSLIEETTIKQQVNWAWGNSQLLTLGAEAAAHRFRPSDLVFSDRQFNLDSLARLTTTYNPFSYAAYLDNNWSPRTWLTLQTGLRWAGWKTSNNHYQYLEPRLLVSTEFKNFSWQLAYARSHQFVHLLANNMLGLFSDLWVPVTDKLRPQRADQLSGGFIYKKNTDEKDLEISLEAYYKRLEQQIDYLQGIDFFANSNADWQQNITVNGRGRAYGLESMIVLRRPKYNGWLSYTLSWNERQFDNINAGEWYPQRYDRRHNLVFTGDMSLGERWRFGTNFVAQTGSWVTLPEGVFNGNTHWTYASNVNQSFFNPIITRRNNQRLPAYHRLDVSFTKKYISQKRKHPTQWVFSIYNLYARRNPFQIIPSGGSQFSSDPELQYFNRRFQSRALLSIVPSVAYSVKW